MEEKDAIVTPKSAALSDDDPYKDRDLLDNDNDNDIDIDRNSAARESDDHNIGSFNIQENDDAAQSKDSQS